MIWIVGSGTCRGQTTDRAKEIIERAEVIYGSRRALELAGVVDDSRARILRSFKGDEIRRILEEGRGKEVAVISTGDPMVAGLGRVFREIAEDVEIEIEPAISSVQVALARLKVDLTEVVVVDCHAKDFDAELTELLKYRHLLILADSHFPLERLGKRRVVLLENLCMEGERIREGNADSIEMESDYTIIFVEREVME